jgi:hypothetical protein
MKKKLRRKKHSEAWVQKYTNSCYERNYNPRDKKRQPQKVNYLYMAVLLWVPRDPQLLNPVLRPQFFVALAVSSEWIQTFSKNITDLCNVDAMCFTGVKNPTFKIFRSPSYYTDLCWNMMASNIKRPWEPFTLHTITDSCKQLRNWYKHSHTLQCSCANVARRATSLYPDAQTYSHAPDQQPAITKVRCHTLGPSV